jgi:hypothetical protein
VLVQRGICVSEELCVCVCVCVCITTICHDYVSTGEVVCYPEEGTKPPQGEGLNKEAVITLKEVYVVRLQATTTR